MQTVCLSVCLSAATFTGCLQREHNAAEALKVKMRGWDAMLGYRTYPEFLHKVVGELEQKAMIQKLLEDAALVRELLTRMSWLAILLATAAFTGAITPPGGWDNGRLFLPYAGNANSLDTCAVLSDSVSGANASKPADTGKDARCPTTIQFGSMRAYNSLILLTFGVSIALVLFLVAFSIPSAKVLQHNPMRLLAISMFSSCLPHS
jgi:hypothetical protein